MPFNSTFGELVLEFNRNHVAVAGTELRASLEFGGDPASCPFCGGYGDVRLFWIHQKAFKSKFSEYKKCYRSRAGEPDYAFIIRKAIRATEQLSSRPQKEWRFRRVRCPLCAGWRNIDSTLAGAFLLFVSCGYSRETALAQMQTVLAKWMPLHPPKRITKASKRGERRAPLKRLQSWVRDPLDFSQCEV